MKLCLPQLPLKKKNKTQEFDNLDVTSQQIINILEEYVKPAVAADGGNIVFDSYNEIKL
jgi:Fe-S cluster biogenesis protein NfuA